MTDDDLRATLQTLRVPGPSASTCERAWHRSRLAFASRHASPGLDHDLGRPMYRWALPAVTVLFLLALGMWWVGRVGPDNVLAWRRTLQEMETLFPNHLNAVIERDGDFDVELSEENVGAPGQPLVVEFRRGGKSLRVLGYSGRSICLDLYGTKACFEPLVTGEGAVILSGEGFLWSEDHPSGPAGFSVEAHLLNSTS